MKLKVIMTETPEYVIPELPLTKAARKMRDLDVGFLPVGDGIKIQGVLTDRDIVIRGVAEDLDLNSVKADDLITEDVFYVFDDQDIEFALETMRNKQVRRLVVVNRNKDFVGVVSLGDLATRLEEPDPKAEALESVSTD